MPMSGAVRQVAFLTNTARLCLARRQGNTVISKSITVCHITAPDAAVYVTTQPAILAHFGSWQ
jgi:hypothetical protein